MYLTQLQKFEILSTRKILRGFEHHADDVEVLENVDAHM